MSFYLQHSDNLKDSQYSWLSSTSDVAVFEGKIIHDHATTSTTYETTGRETIS
ncbi:MAG: hypothetical protein JST01_29170 [Cyanobacteria bacterium SZAS TMP-1]|nr:hypothetical protein [Cyanobacteria bacterium SZAS TMP-1]